MTDGEGGMSVDALARGMSESHGGLGFDEIAERLPHLIRRLSKFSFPAIAQVAGGLLTMPDNHPRTLRLEVLAGLAAIHSRGTRTPGTAQVRAWLNEVLLGDWVGRLEDPVEDVFVSNAPSWDGNARLFDGLWPENDAGVRAVVDALLRLGSGAWAQAALRECMALLRLSEAVAERAGVARYTLSSGAPGSPIPVAPNLVASAKANVTFTQEDLDGLGVSVDLLDAFTFRGAGDVALAAEAPGSTTLERHPILRSDGSIIVALPTAVGAAVRRRAMEAADEAGALAQLGRVIATDQFEELVHCAATMLGIDPIRPPEEVRDAVFDVAGTFDQGAFCHLIYVADQLGEVLELGLASDQTLPGWIAARASATASELARRGEYQRGLTIIVHGGVGRGLNAELPEFPPSWRWAHFAQPELLRLAWDHGFDALRMWKIAEQVVASAGRGYLVDNPGGFANLYAYMFDRGMAIIPGEATPCRIGLGSDFAAATRHRLRSALDVHAALGPRRDGWIELQRPTAEVYFREARNLPLFLSRGHAGNGEFLACVETGVRPWWVQARRETGTVRGRAVTYHLWDTAQNWLVRAAPRLEAEFPGLPAGPLAFRILAPEVDAIDPRPEPRSAAARRPDVRLVGHEVAIGCSNAFIGSFATPENTGDRMIVGALYRGARLLMGLPEDRAAELAFSASVCGPSGGARFFHMLPATTPSELVQVGADMPRPRLVQREDLSWSELGLAFESGHSGCGPVDGGEAPKLLARAVDVVWKRVAGRMANLAREGLVGMALANHDAIEKDRRFWSQTASALLSLHEDPEDVVAAANGLEGERGMAGLASRVVVEMALCACPVEGRVASVADLDGLLANVATLIRCANESDAIHWGLTAGPVVVHANGSFGFDDTFSEREHRPYLETHGERGFRAAARGYADAFGGVDRRGVGVDPTFDAAMRDEFGAGPDDLAGFAVDLALNASSSGRHVLVLRRSEVEAEMTRGRPRVDARRAFEALALKPRRRWDERSPKGAQQRDWYPWRFNRRLSVLHRPLAQLDEAADPKVMLLPTMVDRAVQRLFGNLEGLLPGELFDSPLLKAWIGHAVDREGHAFNRRVADAMKGMGFEVRPDLDVTALGGSPALGDVDVLAWSPATGTVYAIECKRLHFARTTGEIGERLAEYTRIAPPGEARTPIQRHLDRIAHLRAADDRVSAFVGIPAADLAIRSALVTDNLVPMQFSRRALALVDIVTDFANLEARIEADAVVCTRPRRSRP